MNPPPFTHTVDIPPPGRDEPDLSRLPSAPGLFAFEDETGGTLALVVSADIRRLVRSRLAAPAGADGEGPSRRIDHREVTRRIRALTVGSALEADWAYLRHARERLPTTYRGLLERWRGWFVHCDPDAPFPRFLATDAPGRPGRGIVLGPFPDKPAARLAIEALEDAFDLCRYHHLLVEAPNATACAYKEMGRCPAPCDGSVTLTTYRGMVREAIEFALAPIGPALDDLERRMREASAALEFESAECLRRRVDAAKLLSKPRFRYVDRLERFRFLVIVPSERRDHARLMLVRGGSMEPWLDVPLDAAPDRVDEVLDALGQCLGAAAPSPPEWDDATVGLLCRFLFKPPKSRGPIEFLPLRDLPDRRALTAALRRLGRDPSETTYQNMPHPPRQGEPHPHQPPPQKPPRQPPHP